MPVPSEWCEATLRGVRDLTPSIRLLEIDPGDRFVPPAPGSHVNVAVRIGARTDTRSYSIVGGCGDGLYRIAVKLLPASRGGSAYMWTLTPGARLRLSAPANSFPLALDRPQYLLIAGGIGITPIYTMALALAQRGADLRLVYACRSAEEAAFAAELQATLGERLSLCLGDVGQRLDLAAEFATLSGLGEAYVCGPIGLMEDAKRIWRDAGRPQDRLRFETFGSSGRFPTVAFRVGVPRLGLDLEVPATTTLLDALEAAGVAMIADCRKGECGLCALDILSVDGVVDHRDVFFSDAEKAANAKLCTCVSRMAGGTLTLDTPDRPG